MRAPSCARGDTAAAAATAADGAARHGWLHCDTVQARDAFVAQARATSQVRCDPPPPSWRRRVCLSVSASDGGAHAGVARPPPAVTARAQGGPRCASRGARRRDSGAAQGVLQLHPALNLLRRLRGAWGMPYGAACGALSIAGVQVLIAKMEAETDPTKRLVAANEKAVSARAAARAWASHTVRVCVCVWCACVCVLSSACKMNWTTRPRTSSCTSCSAWRMTR